MSWFDKHSNFYFLDKSKAVSGVTVLEIFELKNKTSLTIDFTNGIGGALTNAIVESSIDGVKYLTHNSTLISGLIPLKSLPASNSQRLEILTRGVSYIRITLTGSTTVTYSFVGFDLVTAGNFLGTGGGTPPIEVLVLNDREGSDWSNPDDFTATPTNLTSLIVLSVDTIKGVALTETHFNNATLRVYQATTKENIEITLDDYTWTPGTKTLDVTNCTGAFTFATGDKVSLTIPAQTKAYDKTNDSLMVEGLETEGATPKNKMVGISAQNVAKTGSKTLIVDDPATPTDTTQALVTFDKINKNNLLELIDNVGDKTDTATEADTAGTLIAKIRGLAKNIGKIDDASLVNGTLLAIARYIATVTGETADASVVGDVTGTISAKLRGLLKTLGTIGDVPLVNGSQSAQLNYIGVAIKLCELSLAIIDDWDESDRCKVNLIAGQAGIDGNSGNKTDKTVRTTLATDDIPTALVNTNLGTIITALGTIDNSLTLINTDIDTVNTNLGTVITALGTVNTNLGTINTSLGTINTSLGTINTSITTGNTKLDTMITALQIIDDIAHIEGADPVKGALIAGQEASSDPGAGTAGKVYFPRLFHKMLVMAGFDFTTGYLNTAPKEKALPNTDAKTVLQSASTTSADGTAYTNSGNYTDFVFFAKTIATAGGTTDTTDIEIESSLDNSVWHPEHTIIGVEIAGALEVQEYEPVNFSRSYRPYWRARTVKNGALDNLATTVEILPSAE